MSSLTIPPVLSSPRDDATQLYRAFKGTLCILVFIFPIVLFRALNLGISCFRNVIVQQCVYVFGILEISFFENFMWVNHG